MRFVYSSKFQNQISLLQSYIRGSSGKAVFTLWLQAVKEVTFMLLYVGEIIISFCCEIRVQLQSVGNLPLKRYFSTERRTILSPDYSKFNQQSTSNSVYFKFSNILCIAFVPMIILLWNANEYHHTEKCLVSEFCLLAKLSNINQIKIEKIPHSQQLQMPASDHFQIQPQNLHDICLWRVLVLLIKLCRLCFLDLMILIYSP